jgi:Adenylate and Guanylate cyclase catalytic domain/zinc-ribbon domain
VSVCPSCGHRNQPGAKFCSECGLVLAGTRLPAYEERKVVTVLFADLVGFTSRAEQMDPEDVRALLSPFYARLRSELERFGGTVEKFIGDAVMALFGAPVAHEDDPERAVLAALAIRDWVRGEAAKAYVLSELARSRMLADQFDAQIAHEALELAEQLGLAEIRAHVLITAGTGRDFSGDPQGKADIQRGLEIALAGNFLAAAVRGYSNLSAAERMDGDLPEGLRLALEAEKVAHRYGTKATVRWTRGVLIGLWFELGNWDKCAPAADEFLAESAASGSHYQDTWIRCFRSWMRLARGDTEAALRDQRESLISGRQAKDPQILFEALAVSAYVLALLGRADEAQLLLSELFGSSAFDLGGLDEASMDCVLAAEILGRRDQARRWLSTRRDSPWYVAARALTDQEFVAAAEVLDSMGAARSAALVRLRAAHELARAERRAEADDQLRRALSFFRSVDATRFIREAEVLLASPI